ncbi:MAG: efflux RND transporter permease subunit [Pseudomonadota bacterium]
MPSSGLLRRFRRHPVGGFLLIAVVLVSGLYALGRMPVELLPASGAPRVRVHIAEPGVSVAILDQRLRPPLERALRAVPGVTAIASTVRVGELTLELQFSAASRREVVRETVVAALTRDRLPADMAAPRVSIVGEEESPSLVFALTSQARDLEELQAWSRETLARPFRDLRRVGRVKVSGGGTREMVVFASQRRLAGLGLSAADVMRALSAQAVGGRHPVSLTSLTELETFALPLPNGDRVPLAEVAQIAEREAQNPSRALFEGQPAIHLEIHPQRVADAAEAGKQVQAQLAWLRANGQVPDDIRIVTLFDRAGIAAQAHARLAAAGLAAAVCILLLVQFFLRDTRRTLVAGAMMAVSLFAVLALLFVSGQSLNLMTLSGLLLVTGLAAAGALAAFAATATGSARAVIVCLAPAFAAAVPLFVVSLATGSVFRGLFLALLLALPVVLLAAVLLVPAVARRRVAWPRARWLERTSDALFRHGQRHPLVALAAATTLVLLTTAVFIDRETPARLANITPAGELRLRLQGPDDATLAQIAADILQRLAPLPGLQDLTHTAQPRATQAVIDLDAERAAAVGLDAFDVAVVLGIAHEGRIVGELHEDGERYDIRLRLSAADGGTSSFERLLLRGEAPPARAQRAVYLRDVARVAMQSAAAEVRYLDGIPVIEIRGALSGASAPEVLDRVQALVAGLPLPAGYALAFAGEATPARTTAAGLMVLAGSIAFIVAVLGWRRGAAYAAAMLLCLLSAMIGAGLADRFGMASPLPAWQTLVLLAGAAGAVASVLADRPGRAGRKPALAPAQFLLSGAVVLTALSALAVGLNGVAPALQALTITLLAGLLAFLLCTPLLLPLFYRWFTRVAGPEPKGRRE